MPPEEGTVVGPEEGLRPDTEKTLPFAPLWQTDAVIGWPGVSPFRPAANGLFDPLKRLQLVQVLHRGQVRSFGADVGNLADDVLVQFTLDAEAPLLHVRVDRVRGDGGDVQREGPLRLPVR